MKASTSIYEPLVSIAMATFNGSKFISEQLDSLLSQTYSQFEVIITDDLSTDDTRLILNTYQQKDARIKLFFNETNLGYRKTFYNALQHCKGEYILFCDQDDIWVYHKLKTLLGQIADNLLIFSDSELINEQGEQMYLRLTDTVKMLQPGDPATNRGFVIGNCVWGHTIMFHRDLLGYLPEQPNEHPHDWWFAVISSQLNKIKYCAEVLNLYRQHSRNVTQAVPVHSGRVAGRKEAEYALQLSRIRSIAALPFNTDQGFYLEWERLFKLRKFGFSFSLFRFLFEHRKEVFAFKRKNLLAQIVEIRKMCRKIQ